MNSQNIEKPRVLKETKNKIRVEFERTPLLERLKAKFVSMHFVTSLIWYIFRLVLLIGISYIVLFPFFTKIAGSFMPPEDFVNVTVRLIPTKFTLNTYKAIFVEMQYSKAFLNTLLLSGSTAILQTFVCCFIGYGLAKFKFKGNKLLMMLVVLTLIVPHQALQLSLFMNFRYFDIFGILKFLSGGAQVGVEWVDNILSNIKILPWPYGWTLTNTFWPMLLLSVTGLAFKNGLYIFVMRQFFRGVPDELEESAYIDGSGVVRTFITIILPLSIPMMVTVFLFAFSWQWTDSFYTNLFFTNTQTVLMPKIVGIPTTLETNYAGQNLYYAAIRNTCGLMIIAPLVVLFLFCQKFLIQGIERSGITG
ncbi:MAG: carbohydrate ABC transporter permease [Eubacteriales bacterium]|jgi:multiple sugar transport system permease protein